MGERRFVNCLILGALLLLSETQFRSEVKWCLAPSSKLLPDTKYQKWFTESVRPYLDMLKSTDGSAQEWGAHYLGSATMSEDEEFSKKLLWFLGSLLKLALESESEYQPEAVAKAMGNIIRRNQPVGEEGLKALLDLFRRAEVLMEISSSQELISKVTTILRIVYNEMSNVYPMLRGVSMEQLFDQLKGKIAESHLDQAL